MEHEKDSLAIIDSGASKHYLKVNSPVINLRQVNDGANVTLPTGTKIKATHRGDIPVTDLSPTARSCNILPGLTQYALIAVGQLCDDGCDVSFKKHYVVITKNHKIIMKGKRNLRNNMYGINLHNLSFDNNIYQSQLKETNNHAGNLYHLTKTKEVVQYLHCCCFSPATSTWCDAIDKGFFQTWPHLTSRFVRKYLPK